MTVAKRVRLCLAVVLIVTGGLALGGCIYIPMFGRTIENQDLSRQVGDARSDRPVRTDRATIADVVRSFGRPQLVSRDGRRIAYNWRNANGLMLGLCNGWDQTQAALVLEFDPDGVLRRFTIDQASITPVWPMVRPVEGTYPDGDLRQTPSDWQPSPPNDRPVAGLTDGPASARPAPSSTDNPVP